MAGEDSETKEQSAMEGKEWLIDAAVLLIHQLYKELSTYYPESLQAIRLRPT